HFSSVFFFQAEDGIRDFHVTGVQTCALPILVVELSDGERQRLALATVVASPVDVLLLDEPTNHLDIAARGWLERHLSRRHGATRSEERRVGKERRDRGGACREEKKQDKAKKR